MFKRRGKFVLFSKICSRSSTTKTGRHDIAEIWLKVALSTINQIKSICLGSNTTQEGS
jgi:hypothetical protein